VALLSRKVDYALLILSYLHHRPEGGCARVIGDRFGLKKAFAANVLKLLCQRGLVRSQRGTRGGYVLSRPAGQIALAELLDLMGEPFRLADCNPGGPGGCGAAGVCSLEAVCPVRGAIAEVDRRIRAVLQTVSLAEVFGEPGPPAGVGCVEYGLEVALRPCAAGPSATGV
jgi:Rrf2 family protein